MVPFLKQVAEKYYAEGNIESRCFIFPNRRSLVFFRKYLADVLSEAFREASDGDAVRPLVAPEMLTVNDFFYRVYNVQPSDRVSLLLELYDCYKTLNPKAEPLDEFIFWGDIILGDFNDVDKYLVDPEQLFTNVSDFKSMQDTFSYLTERQRKAIEGFVSHFNDRSGKLTVDLKSDSPNVKERFLMIWNILYPLYESYRSTLQDENMAYEGMVYRSIAESLCGHGTGEPVSGQGLPDVLKKTFGGVEKFVFTGLNALNECEKTVMRRMKDRGLAEFCWDYSGDMIRDSRNRSSFFMEENVREFPQSHEWDPEGGSVPRIRVISVPSSTGQVKQIPSILKSIADAHAGGDLSKVGRLAGDTIYGAGTSSGHGAGTDCAIVLPDETLLMPLLNTIPPEITDINVTMGYPMSGSEFYGFMSEISSVQLRARVKDGAWSFYYRPVWSLFSNSIFRKVMTEDDIRKVREIKAAAKLYIPLEDLQDTWLCDLIFRPVIEDRKAADRRQLDAFSSYQLDVISHVAPKLRDDREMALELDFAMEYYRCISRLRAIAPEVMPTTYIRILEQLLAGVSVPFKGEPLKGLQIMGPLETRALDFSNLVILSSNEGIFPRRSVSSSFIPPELRRGFGLPTYEYQDAVWAYYFYRMITRASDVWLLYDSRTEGMKSGEESRYIRQLEYHFRLPLERYVADAPVHAAAVESEIPKTEEDVAAVRSRDLSASSLQNYIACPARFYYQIVKQLRPEEEVAESMDASMIGNVYHHVMQSLYSGEEAMKEGGVPLSSILGRMTVPVTYGYLESWLGREKEIRAKVRELMMEEMNSPEITGRNLVITDVIVRYVMKTLERDMELIKEARKDSFEILGLEERLGCNVNGFSIKGFVDRIDSFAPDSIRVVDYKTGKVLPEDMEIAEGNHAKTVEAIFGDMPYGKKPKIAFQLFIYDLLLERNGLASGKRVVNSVYSTAKLFSEPPAEVEVGRSFCTAMEEKLHEMLDEIDDTSVPFRRTVDRDLCTWCDFKSICGR